MKNLKTVITNPNDFQLKKYYLNGWRVISVWYVDGELKLKLEKKTETAIKKL